MKQINYFLGCKTEEEAKKRFRVLSKRLHPDKPTGSKESFQELIQQYTNFKEEHETKPKSTFERFTEFLDVFKGLYNLKKVDDRWIITFSNFIPSDFITKGSLSKWFHDNRIAEFQQEEDAQCIILSKPYSSIISAALSIYQFIQMSN